MQVVVLSHHLVQCVQNVVKVVPHWKYTMPIHRQLFVTPHNVDGTLEESFVRLWGEVVMELPTRSPLYHSRIRFYSDPCHLFE